MNKSKLVGSVAGVLLVALSVAGSYKFGQTGSVTPSNPNTPPAPIVVDVNSASAAIEAPITAHCGELVIINAEKSQAKSFAWQITPATKNFRVDKDGHQAVLTASTSAEYVVIVAVAKGDSVDVKSVTVRFVGGDSSDLSGKITDWAGKVTSTTKRDDALKLGQSFLSVAAAVQSGAVTPQTIVDVTQQSNRDALGTNLTAWKTFLDSLGVEVKAQATAGKLPDKDAHVKLWKEIGNALKDYAATL